jgi:hypothetical protein
MGPVGHRRPDRRGGVVSGPQGLQPRFGEEDAQALDAPFELEELLAVR